MPYSRACGWLLVMVGVAVVSPFGCGSSGHDTNPVGPIDSAGSSGGSGGGSGGPTVGLDGAVLGPDGPAGSSSGSSSGGTIGDGSAPGSPIVVPPPPPNHRALFNFNYGWKFNKGDVAGAGAATFNDSA